MFHDAPYPFTASRYPEDARPNAAHEKQTFARKTSGNLPEFFLLTSPLKLAVTGFLTMLIRAKPTRSINLKTSLMARIILVAITCFALVMAIILFEIQMEAAQRAEKTASLVARHLNFQLLRINLGSDASNRFPDWDALLNNMPTNGLCIRLDDEKGRTKNSICTGSIPPHNEIPLWFSSSHSLLFGPNAPTTRQQVSYRGRSYGTVVVSSDANALIAHSWREMRNMLSLTAFMVFSLCTLAYVAIGRALAPAKDVIAGLNRLADGEFAHRLPNYPLSELQRISEVSNQLAEKIETTLAERTNLTKRLMNTQEQERRHLARELHDEFGQNLTAITALAASIEKTVESDHPSLTAEAQSLSQISMKMMTSLRGTLLHLRPADLDKVGLKESLRQLIAVCNSSNRNKTCFELYIPEEIPPLADSTAVHIFRIAQEGLTNAAKHADAKTVRLSVKPIAIRQPASPQSPAIQLTIKDDGKGRHNSHPSTKTDGTASYTNGMGILNMRERVAALGGFIKFEDRAQTGLTVHVTIPIMSAKESVT